jgi:16S rRNA (guanine527-N7)-methyltransferase
MRHRQGARPNVFHTTPRAAGQRLHAVSVKPLGAAWRGPIECVLRDFQADRSLNDALEQLIVYLDLAAEWNQKVNLTAASNPNEFADLFLADAAAIASVVRWAPFDRWVDVGSGAGAPAIALALLVPEIEMTLVEPRAKRVAFLRSALGALNRPDIRVERCRSEQLAAGRWQAAVSRATFAPEQWLQEGARLATDAVWVLLGAGPWPTLKGWRRDQKIDYRWPLTGAGRRAGVFVPESTTGH